MEQKAEYALLARTVQELLEETFEKVHGIYLDRQTSLYETLNGLSAEEASQSIIDSGTSIAAHVEHVHFYLDVIADFMQGKRREKLDWKQSWLVHRVNDQEWKDLQARLHEQHQRVAQLIGNADWNNEEMLGGALGMIVHTAYHLGAIRQILRSIRT